MITPRGCLKSITAAFRRLARTGDVEGLGAYLRSDTFLHAFNGLDPERRESVMRTHSLAEGNRLKMLRSGRRLTHGRLRDLDPLRRPCSRSRRDSS
jgi:hypothetical protein